MVSIDALLGFSLIALGVALTPGRNMVYVTSRSLIHGRWAGMVALSGMTFGALCYLALAAFGVAVVLSAVPHAYDVLRIAGAIYLGYLAWKSVHAAGWINVDARPVSRSLPHTVSAPSWVSSGSPTRPSGKPPKKENFTGLPRSTATVRN